MRYNYHLILDIERFGGIWNNQITFQRTKSGDEEDGDISATRIGKEIEFVFCTTIQKQSVVKMMTKLTYWKRILMRKIN